LRATLAHFRHLYNPQAPFCFRLSTDHLANPSLTKYRSIREVKMRQSDKEFHPLTSAKKKRKLSPSREQLPEAGIRSSDLIQLIKFKLEEKKPSQQRLKTETQAREEGEFCRSSKRKPDISTLLFRSAKLCKKPKRKKIDLSITNTKCDLVPRTNTHTFGQAKEVVVQLRQRPSSAFPARATVGASQASTFKHKFSEMYTRKTSNEAASRHKPVQESAALSPKGKDLSGWDIPSLEDSCCVEEVATGRESKRKRRRKRRG
jgi:hypothetical protein